MYLISTAALIFTRSEFSNIDDNIETLEIYHFTWQDIWHICQQQRHTDKHGTWALVEVVALSIM